MKDLAKRDILDIQAIMPQYANLPSGADPLRQKLWDAVTVYIAFGKGFAALQPILGKVILKVQETESWREWGYHSFSDFVTRGMQDDFKLPSSQAWACYRLVSKWPSLDVNEAIAIGSVNLRELSRVSAEGENGSGKWLEKAKTLPSSQFKNEVSRHIGSNPVDDKLVRIELVVRSEVKDHWEQFITGTAIKALGADVGMSELLEALLAEAESSWQRN